MLRNELMIFILISKLNEMRKEISYGSFLLNCNQTNLYMII